MDFEKIFNTKKDRYHISFQFIIWSFSYLPFPITVVSLHRSTEWVESFLKNFPKGRSRKPSEVSMNLYVVFVRYNFLSAISRITI